MKQVVFALVGLCLMLTACAPITEVHKVGNEYAQNAYSRNFWWPNWQRTTYCWKVDQNGFCPKEDTRVETVTQIAMEAAGHKAAVGAASNAPLALGFGLGLSSMQAARMTQSVSTSGIGTGYISTLNTPAGPFPWMAQ